MFEYFENIYIATTLFNILTQYIESIFWLNILNQYFESIYWLHILKQYTESILEICILIHNIWDQYIASIFRINILNPFFEPIYWFRMLDLHFHNLVASCVFSVKLLGSQTMALLRPKEEGNLSFLRSTKKRTFTVLSQYVVQYSQHKYGIGHWIWILSSNLWFKFQCYIWNIDSIYWCNVIFEILIQYIEKWHDTKIHLKYWFNILKKYMIQRYIWNIFFLQH